jgi:Putative Ig domain
MVLPKKQSLMIVLAEHAARSLCVIALCVVGIAACGGTNRPRGTEGGAPEISGLELSPQPVYANNTLTVLVTPTTPAVLPVHYNYQWRKNDEIIEGAMDATLPNTFFRKGDVVTVTVTTGNGQRPDAAMTSHPVTIHNSEPVVMAVGVTPSPLHPHTSVHAAVEGADADGDAISYSYQWLKDGVELPGQTGESLDGAMVEKGTSVQVQVTPFDGEVTGDPRQSPVVTVQNSPPRITSQPTISLNGDGAYIYKVVAEDPDGGPVTYSLKSAPEGMSIDSAEGTIHWTATRNDIGIHPIEIVVTDEEGSEVIQRYELQITDLQEKTAAHPAAGQPQS